MKSGFIDRFIALLTAETAGAVILLSIVSLVSLPLGMHAQGPVLKRGQLGGGKLKLIFTVSASMPAWRMQTGRCPRRRHLLYRSMAMGITWLSSGASCIFIGNTFSWSSRALRDPAMVPNSLHFFESECKRRDLQGLQIRMNVTKNRFLSVDLPVQVLCLVRRLFF